MKLRNFAFSIIASAALFSCACGGTEPVAQEVPEQEVPEQEIPDQVGNDEVDLRASLLKNMGKLRSQGIMFGAQIPTEYGLSGGARWENFDGTDKSDTKVLTGSHPAVCGWDISEIELEHSKNIDGEPFDAIRKHIQAAYGRGAVNTISWHCANPVTMGNSWDNTPAVKPILPGGAKHELFCQWLDRVAAFLDSIRTPEGERIPLIFRP